MIKTAEELLANNIDALRDFIKDDDIYYFYRGVICEFAKGFAEMHVTEALKEASKFVIACGDEEVGDDILEIYSIDLIK